MSAYRLLALSSKPRRSVVSFRPRSNWKNTFLMMVASIFRNMAIFAFFAGRRINCLKFLDNTILELSRVSFFGRNAGDGFDDPNVNAIIFRVIGPTPFLFMHISCAGTIKNCHIVSGIRIGFVSASHSQSLSGNPRQNSQIPSGVSSAHKSSGAYLNQRSDDGPLGRPLRVCAFPGHQW